MSRLVTIDPDLTACGVALFVDDRLVWAGAASAEIALLKAHMHFDPEFADVLICEMPQQYGRVGDQRDFLALARLVGRFEQWTLEAGHDFRVVAPHEWKGRTPKDVCTRRAWEALARGERDAIQLPTSARRVLERGGGLKSGRGSDVMDAAGIGLWRLGRMNRRLKRPA